MEIVITTMTETSTAQEILRCWLAESGKSIAQLNRELGYKSNYCYIILAPSNPRPITYDVVGRLEVRYGARGPARKIADVLRRQVRSEGNCI